MTQDSESLVRVLRGIKQAAKGFRTEKLKGRLSSKPEVTAVEVVANPLNDKPDEMLAKPAGMDSGVEPEKKDDEEMPLEEIRKLLASC